MAAPTEHAEQQSNDKSGHDAAIIEVWEDQCTMQQEQVPSDPLPTAPEPLSDTIWEHVRRYCGTGVPLACRVRQQESAVASCSRGVPHLPRADFCEWKLQYQNGDKETRREMLVKLQATAQVDLHIWREASASSRA